MHLKGENDWRYGGKGVNSLCWLKKADKKDHRDSVSQRRIERLRA